MTASADSNRCTLRKPTPQILSSDSLIIQVLCLMSSDSAKSNHEIHNHSQTLLRTRMTGVNTMGQCRFPGHPCEKVPLLTCMPAVTDMQRIPSRTHGKLPRSPTRGAYARWKTSSVGTSLIRLHHDR